MSVSGAVIAHVLFENERTALLEIRILYPGEMDDLVAPSRKPLVWRGLVKAERAEKRIGREMAIWLKHDRAGGLVDVGQRYIFDTFVVVSALGRIKP